MRDLHPENILQNIPFISITLIIVFLLLLYYVIIPELDFQHAFYVGEVSSDVFICLAGLVDAVDLAFFAEFVTYEVIRIVIDELAVENLLAGEHADAWPMKVSFVPN